MAKYFVFAIALLAILGLAAADMSYGWGPWGGGGGWSPPGGDRPGGGGSSPPGGGSTPPGGGTPPGRTPGGGSRPGGSGPGTAPGKSGVSDWKANQEFEYEYIEDQEPQYHRSEMAGFFQPRG